MNGPYDTTETAENLIDQLNLFRQTVGLRADEVALISAAMHWIEKTQDEMEDLESRTMTAQIDGISAWGAYRDR
jgi:hypothetical protein